MGATTTISWTDATFNPWWGCRRVSRACKHCYAEAFAKRTGHDVWGKDAARRLFGDKHWAEPLRWNAKAEKAGVAMRVFCASMADVFEDHPVLPPQRERLWDLIDRTPWLRWQLLTKRPENMRAMVPERWSKAWPTNVWAGTTTEDQETADERIPHLLRVPAHIRFVSYEPAVGPLVLRPGWAGLSGIHWAIVGGESGPGRQAMDLAAAEAFVAQCRAAGVAVWVKQDSGPRPGTQGRLSDDLWSTKELPDG